MSVPRLSQRQKAGLAVALALLLWAPLGISHEGQPVVTGHSTFYNGDVYDKCLGSIAGIIRSRVMWFNNQVLVERYSGKGTFVYVTEMGADDPRAADKLYTEGVFYDFVDPNGVHWHIDEYFYNISETVDPPPISTSPDHPGVGTSGEIALTQERTMVWVVELAARPIFDDFAGDDPHTYYNFLTLVDTCKMHKDAPNREIQHDLDSGQLNDGHGHPNGEVAHEHQEWMVNLWVGVKPTVVVPYGVSTDGAEWESDWASETAGGEAQDASSPYLGDLAP